MFGVEALSNCLEKLPLGNFPIWGVRKVEPVRLITGVVDGGPTDFVGDIYVVGDREYFIRIYNYTEEGGTNKVVVANDSYQEVVNRPHNSTQMREMTLSANVSESVKDTLRAAVQKDYRPRPGKAETLSFI